MRPHPLSNSPNIPLSYPCLPRSTNPLSYLRAPLLIYPLGLPDALIPIFFSSISIAPISKSHPISSSIENLNRAPAAHLLARVRVRVQLRASMGLRARVSVGARVSQWSWPGPEAAMVKLPKDWRY